MRTSQVSRDTSNVFRRVSGSTSTPRRTTRSLTRFVNATASAAHVKAAPTLDIEDAITPPAKRLKRTPIDSPTNGIKTEILDDALPSISSPPTKAPRRARKPARKTIDASTGETAIAAPSDWEEMYDAVRRMRAPGGAAHGAAVDTMGCERLADEGASERDQRFHTLIALMLSSQTKDTVNAVAMGRLKTELPAYKLGAPVGLNLENVLAVEPDVLNQMIWAVGFHNNKTKYIKQAALLLRDKWNGDIPDTIEGLTSLPGVGPKMGYLCLSAAWDRTDGIGVDVHVHRITNLWGWNKTKNPEETRLALQSWLPRDRWREINSLLVGLGQAVCLPVGRKCGDCELGINGLCKAADRKKVAEGRKMKTEAVKAEDDGTGARSEDVKQELTVKEETDNGSGLGMGDVKAAKDVADQHLHPAPGSDAGRRKARTKAK